MVTSMRWLGTVENSLPLKCKIFVPYFEYDTILGAMKSREHMSHIKSIVF